MTRLCTRGGALCLLFVLYGGSIWCWWAEQVSPHGDNNWLSPSPASQWASERRLSQHQSGRCTRIRTKLCIQIRTDEWLRSLSSVMRFRNGRTPGIPHLPRAVASQIRRRTHHYLPCPTSVSSRAVPICRVSRVLLCARHVTVSVCPLSAVTLSVPCLTYLNFPTITFLNLKTSSSLRLGRSSLNLQPRSSPSDAGSGAPPPENHPAPLPPPFQTTIP